MTALISRINQVAFLCQDQTPFENHLAWSHNPPDSNEKASSLNCGHDEAEELQKRTTKFLKWDARKILICLHCVNNVFGCYRLEWLNDWNAKRTIYPSLALHAECSGSDFSFGHVKASSLLLKVLQQKISCHIHDQSLTDGPSALAWVNVWPRHDWSSPGKSILSMLLTIKARRNNIFQLLVCYFAVCR